MRKFILAFAVLVATQLNSCSGQPDPKTTLPPREFQQKYAESGKAILLDVRTPEEYAEGYILNAINIDWQSADFTDQVSKLDTAKTIFIYCRSGVRSAAAASKMRQLGFNVLELRGGIEAWREAGLHQGNSPADSTSTRKIYPEQPEE